jgi:hypothetical protein
MTVRLKTSVKSVFETGDKPSQTNFEDLIDSYVQFPPIDGQEPGGFLEVVSAATSKVHDVAFLAVIATAGDPLAAIAASVAGGGVGVIEVVSTAAVTMRAAGALGALAFTLNAEVSAASTSTDFTSITAAASRITVLLDGVSHNGASGNIIIQLGDAEGIETSGYLARAGDASGTTAYTAGFGLRGPANSTVDASTLTGAITLTKMDSTNNTWICSGNVNQETANANLVSISGSKSLSNVLTQIRLTTAGGTDSFDGGTVTILVE